MLWRRVWSFTPVLLVAAAIALFFHVQSGDSRPAVAATQVRPAVTARQLPPVVTPEVTATPRPTATTDPPVPTSLPFGHEFTYTDGVVVSAVRAQLYVASSSAFGLSPGQRGLRVQVRIVNNSGAAVDLKPTTADLMYGASGEQSQRLFDMAAGVLGFTGPVAPGKTATAWFGFSVPTNPGPLQVAVSPSFGYQDALFAGSVS